MRHPGRPPRGRPCAPHHATSPVARGRRGRTPRRANVRTDPRSLPIADPRLPAELPALPTRPEQVGDHRDRDPAEPSCERVGDALRLSIAGDPPILPPYALALV